MKQGLNFMKSLLHRYSYKMPRQLKWTNNNNNKTTFEQSIVWKLKWKIALIIANKKFPAKIGKFN